MEENNASREQLEAQSPQPIETNYPAHQQDPGPAEPAVVEKDKNGASKVLRWIIPLIVILLAIAWFFIM